jgi:hypothetical protein
MRVPMGQAPTLFPAGLEAVVSGAGLTECAAGHRGFEDHPDASCLNRQRLEATVDATDG